MTDRPDDARIRALMVELAESAPVAPSAADLGLDADGLVAYASPVREAPRRRHPFRAVAAVAATLGLVGGGGFALASLTADDGSNRPEAAVEHFVESLANEDALGVLESLAPNERDVLVPALREAVPELERVGLLSGVDLSSVGGFDFDVVGLELTSRYLTDDLAAVRITAGSFVSSVSPSEIPIGPAVGALVTESGKDLPTELDAFAREVDGGAGALVGELNRVDVEILVVRNDGWHVSLQYTAAEAARKAADVPLPDFAASLTPVGADSPEAAVELVMAAASSADAGTTLVLIDPVEMPIAYDYGRLLVDQIDATMTEPTFTIEQMSVTGEGSVRRVSIDAYTTEYNDGSYRSSNRWDGRCITYSSGPVDGPDDDQGTSCVDDPDVPDLSFGYLAITWTVTERDGRWYVSPLRSTTDALVEALRAAGPVTSSDEGWALFASAYQNPLLTVFLRAGVGASGGGDTFTESGSETSSGPAQLLLIPDECVALQPTEQEWATLPQVQIDTLEMLGFACAQLSGAFGDLPGPLSSCFDGIDVTSGVRPDAATLATLSECLVVDGTILGEPPAVCDPFVIGRNGATNAEYDRNERCLWGTDYYPESDSFGYIGSRTGTPAPTSCPQPVSTEGESAAALDAAWGAHVRCVLASPIGDSVRSGLGQGPASASVSESCGEILDPSRTDEQLGRAIVDYQDCVFG